MVAPSFASHPRSLGQAALICLPRHTAGSLAVACDSHGPRSLASALRRFGAVGRSTISVQAVVCITLSLAAHGAAQTTIVAQREGALRRPHDVSFRVATGGDALLVPVQIMQKNYLFVVDTGCAVTCVDRSLKPFLGEPLGVARAETANGQSRFEVFSPPEATIHGKPITGVSQVCCIDFSQFRAISGYDLYGFIGMDFLTRHVLRIDFDRGILSLLTEVPADSGTPVPLILPASAKTPMIQANIVGIGEYSFEVDTGMVGVSSIGVDNKAFERLLSNREAIPMSGGRSTSFGKTSTYRNARLHGLALGDFLHHDVLVSGMNGNRVGLGYLSRYIVTFDFPRRMIYLKPGLSFNEPFRSDLSGLHILRPNGKTVVHSIDKSSVGEAAGLHAEDVIEQIGGRAAASLTMFQIRKMLCTPGSYSVTVKRGQKAYHKELVLDERLNRAAATEEPREPSIGGTQRR